MVPEKDPFSYTLVTYFWVLGISVFGGVASYIRKIRQGIICCFSLHELVGEIVVSAFVGIVTFYLCEYAHIYGALSAALIAIASHMGSRAIFIFETAADSVFQRFMNTKKP